MQTDVVRTVQLNVKLSAEEAERLDRLAAHYSVSQQNVVRLLIKRAADELATAETHERAKPRKR